MPPPRAGYKADAVRPEDAAAVAAVLAAQARNFHVAASRGSRALRLAVFPQPEQELALAAESRVLRVQRRQSRVQALRRRPFCALHAWAFLRRESQRLSPSSFWRQALSLPPWSSSLRRRLFWWLSFLAPRLRRQLQLF